MAIDYEGGLINLIRPDNEYIDGGYVPPEFLSIEDLFFYTCIQEKDTPIRTSVLCKDDTSFEDITLYRWEDKDTKYESCYLGSYDISKKECGDLVIESEYVKDDEVIKITQPLKIKRFSSVLDVILNTQYSDGGWKNSTETAAGVWGLSHYGAIFEDEIVLANKWLKEYRDNEFKCWPNEDCSVLDTAKILAFLTLANNNDSLRIMYDGNVFLKKWQNYYEEGDDWNLTVLPFESGNTNCIISYDRNHLNNENFVISENETKTYTLDAAPDERLIVICDQNINATLRTDKDEDVFIYEGDNMSYYLPYQCWPSDAKWGGCDLEATLYAMLTDIEDERKEAALNFLENVRRSTPADEDYLQNQLNITPTALYLMNLGLNGYSSYDEENIISWLRYKQNNEGSWFNGSQVNRLKPTIYSLMGLMENDFSRNHEVIRDGEDWINSQELAFSGNKTTEYRAWNITEFNALALTVLKNNARPLLKVNPSIAIMDTEDYEIEIYNPTPFPLKDLEYEFSDNLKDNLKISEEKDELRAYSYLRLDIESLKKTTGNTYGYLSIFNLNEEIAKIPVMIVDYPTLSMKQKQSSLKVFGTNTKMDFDISKTQHVFDCVLEWEDEEITSKTDYKLAATKTLSVDISFKNAERMENTYKGKFTCSAQSDEFEIPFSVDVSRYASFPFSVDNDRIMLNSSIGSSVFTIKNNLDESLEVSVGFQKNEKMFSFSKNSFVIDPNDEANITIFNDAPPDINLTVTNTITVEALGQTKNLNFKAFIIGKAPEKKSKIGPWFLLIVLVIIIGGGGFATYYYKDYLLGLFKGGGGSKVDKIKIRIKKLEQKEKKTAILNMIHIMRMLNKDDTEIRKKLKEESFTDEEIDKAFNSELEGDEDDLEEGSEKESDDAKKK